LFTGALAANYDPKAKCPETDQALKEIQPEEKDRRALWIFGSYILIPDCRMEQCMFWKGLGGSGMGTAVKIYNAPLGESLVTNQDMNVLGDSKRYSLSLLKYAMLNLSTELSTKLVEDTAIWIALVVGEYTMSRILYEQYKKLKSSCKHILQGNNPPNIKKATKADLRRIVPIAFTQEFTKEDRDVELKKHMDTERDGMLLKMIQGVPELLSMSALPEGGKQSVALARRMGVRMDPTAVFLDKCTYIDPLDEKGQGICCFKEDLIWAYNEFMKECGMHQMVDESGHWLSRLYDDYNIPIKQPRAYNPRQSVSCSALI